MAGLSLNRHVRNLAYREPHSFHCSSRLKEGTINCDATRALGVALRLNNLTISNQVAYTCEHAGDQFQGIDNPLMIQRKARGFPKAGEAKHHYTRMIIETNNIWDANWITYIGIWGSS